MSIPTNPDTLGKPPYTCDQCRQPAWILDRDRRCVRCRYPDANH